MPRRDGTGPAGMGPMTGRGMGYCDEFAVPGYINPEFSRGMGLRRGFGRGASRGFREGFPGPSFGLRREFGFKTRSFYQTPETNTNELPVLKEQEEYLKETLKNLKGRISELEK